jgi:precorrin-6B methylase 2
MATDERDRLSAFALRVWGYKQGEVVSLMIHLGDRLGLYRAMAGRGPVTAAALAAATGLQERWLLEWLRGQAAAGLIGTEDGQAFEISAEAVAVLADDRRSLWFAAGAFAGGAAPPEVVARLAGAFGSGIGLTYDDLGPAAAQAIERMTEPWTRLALVPLILPALDSVAGRLHAGALVADAGCGPGVAACTRAAAVPGSRFEGLDPSPHAIGRARRRAADSGLENAEFRTAAAEDLPGDNRYGFVLTLDCLHDMPRPGASSRRHPACRPAGRHVADQGHPVRPGLAGQPPQSCPGPDVRAVGDQLPVLRPVRAGRSRTRDARPSSRAHRADMPRSRILPLCPARLR